MNLQQLQEEAVRFLKARQDKIAAQRRAIEERIRELQEQRQARQAREGQDSYA